MARRKHPNIYVALDALDEQIRDKTLADPAAHAAQFEEQVMLNETEDSLQGEGPAEIRLVYQLVRRGYRWQDIARMVGDTDPERVKSRFDGWVKRAGSA